MAHTRLEDRDSTRWSKGQIRTIFSPYHDREIAMRYSTQVKPISYLKSNAAEVLRTLAEQREPMIITQNGEARAVIQDVASYEETQETLALLKILALGTRDIEEGDVVPVRDAVARIRARRGQEG
jgi:prevent-host-death family protein